MENTSNTSEFINCFKSNLSFNENMNKWKHLLDKHCNRAFPKIRIRKHNLKPSKADQMINERNSLMKGTQKCDQEYLDNLNVKIANTISNEERLKCHVMKKFCSEKGSINVSEMWKVKKKLWPIKHPLCQQQK